VACDLGLFPDSLSLQRTGASTRMNSSKLALLHIGAFTPDVPELRDRASSVPANLIQLNMLAGLPKAGLPEPTVFTYVPVQSFPKHKKLFHFRKRIQDAGGRVVTTLGHINFGPLKVLTLGVTAAWAAFSWGLRNRSAQRRIVICYNLTAPPAVFLLPICKLLKMELVPYIGDIYVPGETVPNTWLRRLEYRIQTKIVAKAAGLLVCNQAIIDDFAPGRSGLLMDGGVPASFLERLRGLRLSEDGDFTVVFAAELDDLDGIHMLLGALRVLRDMPGLRVKVFGRGKYADDVLRAAELDPRIEYLGFVPYEELLDAYGAADLLLVLRSTELRTQRYFFPFKFIECVATGTPVLTTCTGHIEREFGPYVHLLREETPDGLAKAISDLAAASAESRSEFGKKAQRYVMENKTWDAQGARIANYLQNLGAASGHQAIGHQVTPSPMAAPASTLNTQHSTPPSPSPEHRTPNNEHLPSPFPSTLNTQPSTPPPLGPEPRTPNTEHPPCLSPSTLNTQHSTPRESLRVLAVVDYYLPGYKGGGPAVSVSRLIQGLSSEVEFAVFTRNHDLGEAQPYADVPAGTWFAKEGVRYYYAKPNELGLFGMLHAIRSAKPDVVYLNSYFSKLTRVALTLRWLGLTGKTSCIVAPRGEFSPGALALKAGKKRAYLAAARAIGFHRGVTWQVSSEHEERDTLAAAGVCLKRFIKAPDVALTVIGPEVVKPTKVSGSARFAFISRISPKKNLLGAIESLRQVQGEALFTIYGPIEDAEHWSQCEAAIASLPPNVRCEHAGGIPSSEVAARLEEHHFFLFPTLGENFGHVIPEALNAGCPVLLSDQTPWLDLDSENAGWVMPLDARAAWTSCVQECVDMDTTRYLEMSEASRAYVRRIAERGSSSDESRRMFEYAREAA
jgi:glycosyltransferase involved in cell wall biosynthesis